MCMVKENLFNKEKELKQTNVNSDWTQLFRKVSFIYISKKNSLHFGVESDVVLNLVSDF